eukprot:gene12862-7207_t
MSSLLSDPKIPTLKRKHTDRIIREIDEGIDEAFDDVLRIMKDTGNEKKDMKIKLSELYTIFNLLPKIPLDNLPVKDLTIEFIKQCEHCLKESSCSTIDSYKTFDNLTDDSFNLRSLEEAQKQYFIPYEETAYLRITSEWLKDFPHLKFEENDSKFLKEQKYEYIKQIYHSVRVGEKLFKRKEFKNVSSSNFLLQSFAQWLNEEIFKSNIDESLHQSLNLNKEFEHLRNDRHRRSRLDLSNLYGSNLKITNSLRLKQDGKLKSQKIEIKGCICEFPPKLSFKTSDLGDDEVSEDIVKMNYPSNFSKEDIEKNIFAMGGKNLNLHFGLIMIQTYWLREHNSVCESLKKQNPSWNDERLFQTSRLILIGELSKCIVEDFLNHILGHQGFHLKFDPTEFFNAGIHFEERFHHEENYLFNYHSMMPESIILNEKELKFETLNFKTDLVKELGLEEILNSTVATEVGYFGLRNTPKQLINEEIKILLHSRLFKTQSYCAYKRFFEDEDIVDFDDITSDEELQKLLEIVYGNVKNVDYYIGLLAEDHKDGISGDLMQFQFAIYTLSNVFSNPICLEKNWNEKTFTKFGFERIKSTNFLDLINRNTHENESNPVLNLKFEPNFKIFSNFIGESRLTIPNYEKEDSLKFRKLSIEKSRKKWIIDFKGKPIHRDDEHITSKVIFRSTFPKDPIITLKKRLHTIFKTLLVSSKTPGALIDTFYYQIEIILSILSSDANEFLSDTEIKTIIQNLNEIIFFQDSDEILDKIYGFSSKHFSTFQSKNLKNFNWNKDEIFGDLFLNGLDPTQLKKLKEDNLKTNLKGFNEKSFIQYFEKTFKKKFKEEMKNESFYFIDNYQTMNLIKIDPINIAKPKSLFYYDRSTQKLLPVGIQLNNKKRARVKIIIENAENLKKMDIFGKTDSYVQVECRKKKKSTSVSWNSLNPKWNEKFEFECLYSDQIFFTLRDYDILKSEFMGKFDVSIFNLQGGKNKFKFDIDTGGTLNLTIELVSFEKDQEEKRIFTKANPNWTIAKLFVSNAFIQHQVIVSHNLKTHKIMEAVSICMHHSLFKNHPIFNLLLPHVYYTDLINMSGRQTLFKEKDGSGVVSVLFSCGTDFYEISDFFFNKFNFTNYLKETTECDVNIPNYFYKQDTKKIWSIIETYVANIIRFFYKKEQDINNDFELIQFIMMLTENIPGMLKVENISDLIYLLTGIIFNATTMHAAVHKPQIDSFAFAPLMPTILNSPPPLFEDKSFGEVKDGFTLSDRQQRMVLQYLPTIGQSIVLNSSFYYITLPTDNPLVNEKINPFQQEPCYSYFMNFIKDIETFSDQLLHDPKRANYHYFAELDQSIIN